MAILSNKQQLKTSAARLKYIRSLLRVTRSYLQEKYGLPEVTLKSWESGSTKLTKVGVSRCLKAYRAEGIIVSDDWIMDGIGLDPKVTATVSHYFATVTDQELSIEDDETAMIMDADNFKKSHSTAVIMIVSNDDMRPFYSPGDYIGGKMRYGNDIEAAIGKDCIVYLKDGERFFRRLIKNSKGRYNLTCLNPNETTPEPVIYNVDIEAVAPVIWRRWKDY